MLGVLDLNTCDANGCQMSTALGFNQWLASRLSFLVAMLSEALRSAG